MTYEEIGYKEAAEIVGYVADKNSYTDWAVSDKQREAFKLAARVLRSVASANADAGVTLFSCGESDFYCYRLLNTHFAPTT